MRALLIALCLGSLSVATYTQWVAHNPFTEYSGEQLTILSRSLDRVASGGGPAVEKARTSRAELQSELARRKRVPALWALGVLFAGLAFRFPSRLKLAQLRQAGARLVGLVAPGHGHGGQSGSGDPAHRSAEHHP